MNTVTSIQNLIDSPVLRTITCDGCQKPFTYTGYFNVRYCGVCTKIENEKFEALERDKKRAKQLERFLRMCPVSMAETDVERLPQSQYEKVMVWHSTDRGLILYGKPRQGKTRCLWMLIKRLIVEEGQQVKFLMLYDSETLLEKLKRAEYREELMRVPYLALDDLGKEKCNDQMETMIFNLIAQRVDHKRPTLITTNFIGNLLAERFYDPIKGKGIVERIREFCDGVSFGSES